MSTPNFLIIGAQKAGTTWLHRNLQAHPGVWMPKEKELHFFDEKAHTKLSIKEKLRGEGTPEQRWRRQVVRQARAYKTAYKKDGLKKLSVQDLAWDLRYFLGRPSDGWYASLFKGGKGRTTGEATPDYSILGAEGVTHVRRVTPEAKIIFLMRNPMERAWSQAMMDLGRFGPLEEQPFERFKGHFRNRRSRQFGDYAKILETWESVFPGERIFAGFLEDVHFVPDLLLEKLYGFLGVSTAARYRVIRRKIHTRAVETIPRPHARFLARLYREDLLRLEERFGGYASFWRFTADRLLDDPPEAEELPYPFWESYLWGEWLRSEAPHPLPGSPEAGPYSGPLSEVARAAS